MYSASEAFHAAVQANKPQIAMLIFRDAVFTNEDINVTNGIEFNDYFNAEEDLSIGQALSNEINFSLFNDARLLNDYAFGDFLATIGVQVRTETYQQTGSVMLTTNIAQWVGSYDYPYIKRNGTPLLAQPSFAVRSMLGYDGKVWAFGDSGQYVVYEDRTGMNITPQNPVNAFMQNKSRGWVGKGMYYNNSTRMLDIYEAGTRYVYEFVPLGHFIAERPKAPDVIQIDMTCNDFMMKFEKDMPTKAQLGISYPATISTLFVKMCNYVGVEYKTASFINSGARIMSDLEDFERATMREVIGWIAEAACGNARFDRDGKLTIDWLRDTSQQYEATNYETFNPYWYETRKVTKLYNRGTDGSYDKTVGSGDEGYLIQDNPLLRGVN